MNITVSTVSGENINVFSPSASSINEMDVARSLSNQCRYNGHVDKFFCVGEHSCLIYDRMLQEEDPLTAALGLIHDAPESILSDVVTPLKRHMFLVQPGGESIVKYSDLEDQIFDTVASALVPGISFTAAQWKILHTYDSRIVHDEWVVLRPDMPVPPRIAALEPLGVKINNWTPAVARNQWLKRLNDVRRDLARS